MKDGDLTSAAFAVDHDPVEPAVGYRFDHEDRSVLIGGDTSQSANLEKFAKAIDLLLHEALSPAIVGVLNQTAKSAGRSTLAKIAADIPTYHAIPREAAEAARDTSAKALLLSHGGPPLPLLMTSKLFLEGVAETYEGPVTIGTDGTFARLLSGSLTVEIEELL